MAFRSWLSSLCFRWVHGNHLVYNACWEDPRLDRQALDLGPQDSVAVITSAGCNVLDYALTGPRRIYAIDVNPRQNALLELKVAGIRALEFEPFFDLFGQGFCPEANKLYHGKMRRLLSPPARRFWDRHIDWFQGTGMRRSFYFYGTSGMLAWLINVYIDWIARVRPDIDHLLAAPTMAEQKRRYEAKLKGVFWNGFLRWCFGQDATLALLGVPPPQRRQVDGAYVGGIAQFIEDRVEAVFSRIPLDDNYFWRVYLTGSYSDNCCPEYLKRDNFQRLKDGLVDTIQPHTGSLIEFLECHKEPIQRFVLLDHMDWLSNASHPLLRREWQALVDRAGDGARLLWRSGGLSVDYVDPIEVQCRGRSRRIGDMLVYQRDLAERLHGQDRVHTYGSMYVADLLHA